MFGRYRILKEMIIKLNKFGTILVSRPAGKEAYLAFQPSLRGCRDEELVEVDFDGVEVLTPSWADEFITPLFDVFKNRIRLKNSDNPSVVESLKILNLASPKE
ncbi:DUF4325 domain-containing protein [Candidatus Woesebacteria bacterium CG22_combo_CG10-13_8_21_14_all_39_10]|uniref:DUF4325 domain-containing protein n=2 Tax=Candidatus Woeseibacteriota TaxID=1752722 RepID=A0A2M7AQT4_9BACT|nr:MAG: DUF4325 domain-containing protein [Candidatus Woesebacteria bacterium CG22_combo_CG10-13_8_21_14_all_39_10]PIU72001.1 MAG: DUF4325 domain-containing protein [Candidatus Woesebacteria bacterium CG06_land_8_20_14_3_00_39_27]